MHMLNGFIPFPTNGQISSVTEQTEINDSLSVRRLGYSNLADPNQRLAVALSAGVREGTYKTLVVGDTNMDPGSERTRKNPVFTENDYQKTEKLLNTTKHRVVATGITCGNQRPPCVSQLDQVFSRGMAESAIEVNARMVNIDDPEALFDECIQKETDYNVRCITAGGVTTYVRPGGLVNEFASNAHEFLKALYTTHGSTYKLAKGRWSGKK